VVYSVVVEKKRPSILGRKTSEILRKNDQGMVGGPEEGGGQKGWTHGKYGDPGGSAARGLGYN